MGSVETIFSAPGAEPGSVGVAALAHVVTATAQQKKARGRRKKFVQEVRRLGQVIGGKVYPS